MSTQCERCSRLFASYEDNNTPWRKSASGGVLCPVCCKIIDGEASPAAEAFKTYRIDSWKLHPDTITALGPSPAWKAIEEAAMKRLEERLFRSMGVPYFALP